MPEKILIALAVIIAVFLIAVASAAGEGLQSGQRLS